MTLARETVRAFAAIAGRPLPAVVSQAALLRLRDAIGVGLAAAGSPVGQPYRRIAERSGHGLASMFGAATGTTAEQAALLNGGLIHSLEYDDTHTASIIHGSSLAAAVSLAVAEETGASGAALLGAFTRCWELLIRIGLAAPGGFQTRGFHVTSVGGTLAAALTAADLMGLDEDERVTAMGIALSQASGVFEFLSNGSSVKSLHPGWAAHAGVYAAKFAAAGMSGPETSLEGRYGLFRHFAGSEPAIDAFREQIGSVGSVWHLPDAAFKLFPCCHFLHPFIEAAGKLCDGGIGADAMERIVCRVPAAEAPIICDPWDTKRAPASGHAVRWSLPVAVAARIVEGHIDLATFERMPPAPVLEFAHRIEWEPMAQSHFPQAFEAELVCETRDGAVTTIRIDDAYGNRSRPAAAAELDAKFNANAARSLSADGVSRLGAALRDLPGAPDLAPLTAAMRCVAATAKETE